jgi:hypothetical protein
MGYTTTDFLSSVKRLATMAQASTQTFTNQQLYTLADNEIANALFVLLTRTMQEYAVMVKDYPVTVGKSKYRIPPRAWGSHLRDVKYVDAQGNEIQILQVYPDQAQNQQVQQAAQPVQYTVQSNSIIVWPTPNVAQGYIRMRYYIRPNRLINVQDAGVIAAIDGQELEVTGPAGWASSERFDALKSSPGFEHVLVDVTPTGFVFDGVSTYTLTFASGVDLTELEVGDYFCRAEETPVPQLPADMHPTLYQRVVVKIQELQGDAQARANAQEELILLQANLKDMHAPRVDSTRIVIPPYLRNHLV